MGPLGFTARTEFEGLFLCGQSTMSHGVAGVTASGIDAAKAILNCGAREILTGRGSGPRFLQAEEAGQWEGKVGEEEDETEV